VTVTFLCGVGDGDEDGEGEGVLTTAGEAAGLVTETGAIETDGPGAPGTSMSVAAPLKTASCRIIALKPREVLFITCNQTRHHMKCRTASEGSAAGRPGGT
jgi:hypothetical protein